MVKQCDTCSIKAQTQRYIRGKVKEKETLDIDLDEKIEHFLGEEKSSSPRRRLGMSQGLMKVDSGKSIHVPQAFLG